MSDRRGASTGKLAPPAPSPSPARDEDNSVGVAHVRGKLSEERPIAADATSVPSTPNPNAVTAAAHDDTDDGVTTPSPSLPARSNGRETSMNSTSEARRSPSARVHPTQSGMSEAASASTSAVAALDAEEVPPPLANSPSPRTHKTGGDGAAGGHHPQLSAAAGAEAGKGDVSEELIDSAPRSPSRGESSRLNTADAGGPPLPPTTTSDPSILLTAAAAATAAAGRLAARGGSHSNSHATAGGGSNAYNVSLGGTADTAVDGEARQRLGNGQALASSAAAATAASQPRSRARGGSPATDAAVSLSRPSGAAPRASLSEPSTFDTRLPTGAAAYPAGMNTSGFTSSQRALVQYVATPGDVATPSYAVRDPATGSDTGYSPSRHAEIRAMLITAERELAEMREECAKRGMKAETLEAALDRERGNLRALRDRHADEAAAAREEHEAQTRQLRDQLHVLKMVSESAMAEKSAMAEEAARRKKELLALLDREREEKSYIMADYREQTESLIAEQGREITHLRSALDKLKCEYDELAKQNLTTEAELEATQEKADDVAAQLEKERTDAASRTKDLQANMQQECQALGEQLAAMQEQAQRGAAQAAAKHAALTEQLQKGEEKLRLAEEEHQRTLDTLKQAYRRDTDGLREELSRVKGAYEKEMAELRQDMEKAAKRESKTAESLRVALEQARLEKEASVDEGLKQRETLQRQQRDRLVALQKELDDAAQHLAEERAARKDREADAEVLRVRADNLDKTNQRLSSELEALQADQRSRERATEQAHQAAVEAMRAKLRTALTDLGYAQDQLTQQANDAQVLRDELAKRTAALEAAREKTAKLESASAEELSRAKDVVVQKEKEAAQLVTQLRASKTQLEATCERLERQLKETEGRMQGTVRQVEEERRSLEEASRRLQDARVEVEELRTIVNHERERGAFTQEEKRQLERQLAEEKLYHEELENALHMAERRLQEQQQDQARQLKQMEGRLDEQGQRHQAELAAARIAADQVRGEVARAREAIVEKESVLQRVREEVGRLHREAALREGGLQEEMEDLREAHEVEMRRMDDLLNGLRSDLAKSQAACTQYQRELSHIHRNSAGARSDLEMALEQSDAARAKLLEDAKYRDQLNQELQGTVRLLSSRLTSNEEEVRRVQEELADATKRIQDAHTMIGRKDAAIGQLNARLRAYESRH